MWFFRDQVLKECRAACDRDSGNQKAEMPDKQAGVVVDETLEWRVSAFPPRPAEPPTSALPRQIKTVINIHESEAFDGMDSWELFFILGPKITACALCLPPNNASLLISWALHTHSEEASFNCRKKCRNDDSLRQTLIKSETVFPSFFLLQICRDESQGTNENSVEKWLTQWFRHKQNYEPF